MRTDIIILAQGVQSRLPELTLPKQWLPLPACANEPILYRTLVQLWELLGQDLVRDDHRVTVVCWPQLDYLIRHNRLHVRMNDTVGLFEPARFELPDPGNSSLKGARAVVNALRVRWGGEPMEPADRTVILLGDVVYSWKCLELLLENNPGQLDVTVCGTHDLSPSTGELWGISWHRLWDKEVRDALDRALEKHPPFKEYQPGQLRRWFWQMMGQESDQRARVAACYYNVDDYTDDVDVPADVANLPKVAELAAADDLTRGITWPIS